MPGNAPAAGFSGASRDGASPAQRACGSATGGPTVTTESRPPQMRCDDAADVLDGDGADQVVAPVDVVDAEIVELELQEVAGDLLRGVEAQREIADEVVLGRGELRLGRALGRRSA